MSGDYWGDHARTYEADGARAVGVDILETIARSIAEADGSGDVVELGCGTGFFTRVLAPSARSVIATDLSPAMVEVASGNLARFANVTVRVADAASTGLPDACADTVAAINLIHIVPDPAAVLAEARRLLRPGGTLLVSSLSTERLPFLAKAATALRAVRAFGIAFVRLRRDPTLAELRGLVEAAGFSVRDARLLVGSSCNATWVRAIVGPGPGEDTPGGE